MLDWNTAVLLAWRFSCLAGLSVQVSWYRQFNRSRPLASVSLTDLVSQDLVSHYHLAVCAMVLAAAPVPLGMGVHPAPAFVLVSAVAFFIYSFYLYLVATCAVQYLHLSRRRTSISERLTDLEMQALARTVVSCASLALLGCRFFVGGQVALYNKLVRDASEPDSNAHALIVFALSVLAFLCNLVLRILAGRKRKRMTDSLLHVDSQEEAKRTMIKHLLLAFYFILNGGIFLIFVLVIGVEDGVQAPTDMFLFQLCFVVPSICVLVTPKLRRYFIKKVTSFTN